LQVPAERADVSHAWHLYVLRLNFDRLSISRNVFIDQLALRNIASSVHFIPIHLHRYYREKYGYRPEDFPAAFKEYERMVSLPLHPRMSDQDVEDVIEAVSDIVQKHTLRAVSLESTKARSSADPELPPSASAARFVTRRMFDAACSVLGLAFLAPLFALIALAIKLSDGGPVFYSQWRVGKDLRKFRLMKFRSMVPDSSHGSLLTRQGDPRVTRVGRFLRKYKLDELPQLLNVLKGEMQLVGVRPQVERFVEVYRNEYEELLRVPPGITDLACLRYRNEEELFSDGSIEQQYIQHILPSKLEISLKYARTRTFVSDLEILLRTVLGLKCPVTPQKETRSDVPLQTLSKFISRNSS
jgi:lipopolysaccharide/colanic/teichoic acid biosynthesis glycosyltransferase